MDVSHNMQKLAAPLLLVALIICSQSLVYAWDRGTVAYARQLADISPALPDSTSHLLPASTRGAEISIKLSNLSGARIGTAFLYVGITDFTGRGIQDFQLNLSLPVADTVITVTAGSLAGQPGFYDARALLFERAWRFSLLMARISRKTEKATMIKLMTVLANTP